MPSSIEDILRATKTSIASSTSTEVKLGAPVESKPGLYVFPYLVEEDRARRSPDRTFPNSEPDVPLVVSCLLMANPPEDYAAIDDGLKSLTARPVIDAGEDAYMVALHPLTVEELTRIFASAGVSHRLAVSFVLREVSGR